MAFSYKQRECDTCGGTLEFLKDSNEYVCPYCGNRYERQESYDGQFSVRFAATQALQALLDVSKDARGNLINWHLVETNLNDCQKIDPSYAGSIVANLAASITRVRFLMDDREAVRTDLAQAKQQYEKLGAPFKSEINDVEADFYDNLESSDIRSLLISVFQTFGDAARVEYVQQGFKATDISSETVASDLISRSFASGDYEKIDELLQSPAKLEADTLFGRILNEYPDNMHKRDNIAAIVVRGVNQQRGREQLSQYILQSHDSDASKMDITIGCMNRGIIPNGKALARLISDDTSLTLLGAVKSDVLADEDTDAVINALLTRVKADVMVRALNTLVENGYYLNFSQQGLLSMLLRNDLDVQAKTEAYQGILALNVPEKRRQSVLAGFIDASAPVQTKIALIDMLAKTVRGINPMSAENYLLNNHADGNDKAKVLETIVRHVTARESLKMSANRYAGTTSDPVQVRNSVVAVLSAQGFL